MQAMIDRLQQRREHLVTETRRALASAESEGRALTGQAERDYNEKLTELRDVNERLQELRADQAEDRRGDEYRRALGGIETAGYSDSGRDWLPSLGEYRALAEATDTTGGALVPIQYVKTFEDRLRNASVFLKAGPRILDVDSNEVHIPKLGSSANSDWTEENQPISVSDPSFDSVTLTPRKIAALVYASNEVMADSDPSVREVVSMDLVRTIATKLDVAFLRGSGTVPEPTGISNAAGVNSTELGAGDGAQPTLDDVEDALARVEAANANPSAVFMSPQTWAYLRAQKDGDGRSLVQPDPTSTASRSLFGVPVHTTGNLPHSETVGTSTDASRIVVADMSTVAVGRRKVVEVALSTDYRFEHDQTAVRAVARYDVAPLQAAAIEVLTGVLA